MKKRVAFVILSGLMIFSFQNCQKVKVSDLPTSLNSKAEVQDLQIGQTEDGEILVPVEDIPGSVYVCPPETKVKGTQTSTTPNANTSMAYGVSTGVSVSSSSASSSSSNGTNTASVRQTGDNNSAYVYQSGSNNHSSIIQNGTNNSACVLQVGERNASEIAQAGQNNAVEVEQIGGQNSQIRQSGQSHGVNSSSAQACGCRLVHCQSNNSILDSVCRAARTQNVVAPQD